MPEPKLRKYTVVVNQTTVIRNIEAESAEEAREIAVDIPWTENRGDTSFECRIDVEDQEEMIHG